jgi:hypothetical protein
MPFSSPVEFAHVMRNTPHWVTQAAKAEAYRGMLEYMINNYNMHVDAANRSYQGGSEIEMPKRLRLVEE